MGPAMAAEPACVSARLGTQLFLCAVATDSDQKDSVLLVAHPLLARNRTACRNIFRKPAEGGVMVYGI